MKKHSLSLLIIAILALFVSVAYAKEAAVLENATLFIIVRDPVGDNTGNIDITSMEMVFSNITGDYTIYLTSHDDNKFNNDFRININLFNPDVGTTDRFPSFFQDTLNDYSLASPQSQIILIGSDPSLIFWDANDRVFTNSLLGTGNPDGSSLFRSSVSEPPFGFLTNEDYIAFENTAQPAEIVYGLKLEDWCQLQPSSSWDGSTCEISPGASAKVEEGDTLIILSGQTLLNNDTITNDGSIYNYGTVTNIGTITNGGTIDNGGSINGDGTINIYGDGEIVGSGSNDNAIVFLDPIIEVQPLSLTASQKIDLQTMQPLTITNSGNFSLNWNIVEDDTTCDSPTDITWLSVSPAAGATTPSNDAIVDVTFDSTGLAPGDYKANLCVNSDDPATPQVQVPVILTVDPYTLFVPIIIKD